MTTRDAVNQYLAHLAADGRSPHTIGAYRRDLSTFIRFTAREKLNELDDVTPETLTRFMTSQDVRYATNGCCRASASVNRYRVAVKALYAFWEARWVVARNPTAILRCQKHRGLPPVVLDAAEITKLVNSQLRGNNGPRDHALISFMLLTGCRLAETAALDITDIDLKACVAILRTTKGGDPDRVMLSPKLTKILAKYIGDATNGPLFTAAGRRLSTRQIQRIVTLRVREAGIDKPITAHSLRHSFASMLYNQTGDIRLVQQALRHTHVTTTEIYAQIEPSRWRREVARIA